MPTLDHQYLVFNLEDSLYGFPLRCIKLVLRAVELVKIPAGADRPRGLMDLRGEMVAVYDLRELMGLAPIELNPEQHFIVATPGGHREAFVVDDIDEVVDFSQQRFELPESASLPRFVKGMVRYDDRIVMCLDEQQLAGRSRSTAPPGGALHDHPGSFTAVRPRGGGP